MFVLEHPETAVYEKVSKVYKGLKTRVGVGKVIEKKDWKKSRRTEVMKVGSYESAGV
jgi:hypothetical protein